MIEKLEVKRLDSGDARGIRLVATVGGKTLSVPVVWVDEDFETNTGSRASALIESLMENWIYSLINMIEHVENQEPA